MRFYKIKSYAKINFSLKVLRKLKNKFHKIESLISIINLHDIIYIKKNKKKNIIQNLLVGFQKESKEIIQ